MAMRIRRCLPPLRWSAPPPGTAEQALVVTTRTRQAATAQGQLVGTFKS